MNTNENKKNNKNAKQTRVLVASVVLAGLIVAGGTFAWFTSKDEVTNTLTATKNYGVEITEDFKSPANWLPGEVVDKKVSVVNTGNVDAFARVKLSDSISGTVYGTGSAVSSSSYNPDDAIIELSTEEVKALKAGGVLVSATDSTGNTIGSVTPGAVGTDVTTTADGFYVFQRTKNSTANTTDFGDYVGFVVKGGKSYAVNNVTKSTNVYTTTFKTKTAISDATGGLGTITIDTTTEPGKAFIKSSFTVGGKTVNAKIYLNPDYATNWELGSDGYFYYLKDIKAGKTTENLVDSVELDVPPVDGLDYAEMNYDLKINMDSVQVTPGTDNNAKKSGIPDTWDPTAVGNIKVI